MLEKFCQVLFDNRVRNILILSAKGDSLSLCTRNTSLVRYVSMKEEKRIQAMPIESEEFSLYGEVLIPHSSIDLDFDGHTPNIRMFSAPFRDFVFDEMSRHINSSQTFIPLNGKDFIIAVSPPSDNDDAFAVPDLQGLKAFVVHGARGISLHKGCWHTTPFPFCHKAHIASIQCKKTFEEDLDIKKLRIKLRILFE